MKNSNFVMELKFNKNKIVTKLPKSASEVRTLLIFNKYYDWFFSLLKAQVFIEGYSCRIVFIFINNTY